MTKSGRQGLRLKVSAHLALENNNNNESSDPQKGTTKVTKACMPKHNEKKMNRSCRGKVVRVESALSEKLAARTSISVQSMVKTLPLLSAICTVTERFKRPHKGKCELKG